MSADQDPAQTPAREPGAVPHDPQDQQAGPDEGTGGEDHWDVTAPESAPDEEGSESSPEDVPDTDEAGTARRGEERTGEEEADQGGPTERPEPQEPSG
ncbi:hypothetical protein [Streptomyces sp. Da 82-17]|uniref:hypothetical protein n=1 Tax=Streptomyces sp. Da 82-17 TaxID=3377116 RepID=UPI0038D38086